MTFIWPPKQAWIHSGWIGKVSAVASGRNRGHLLWLMCERRLDKLSHKAPQWAHAGSPATLSLATLNAMPWTS
jgi:hypothetical protein